ncbi:unnamed protein product [Thelazia callipaeda]|uniref:Pentatricopeptide repeat-containing protein n=1 Tax=Thelazia callipaeda TaxID=103827 RepID=A0A0N5D2J3_THECL|nr:unnamed protein product [Thelazia callipaeda]
MSGDPIRFNEIKTNQFSSAVEKKMLQKMKSSSSLMRLLALMAFGMWDEIINLWNIGEWDQLFTLLLSRAPSSKIRRLCSNLTQRLIDEGVILNTALPAIVADDVEAVVVAMEMYENNDCMALTTILRQCVGGGSSRTVKMGKEYKSVLLHFIKKLEKERQFRLALDFLQMISKDDYTEDMHLLCSSLHRADRYSGTEVQPGENFMAETEAVSTQNAPFVIRIVSSQEANGLWDNSKKNKSTSTFPCVTSKKSVILHF